MGTVRLSDKEHPVFRAHFPDQPILPGFIHLEIISKLFGQKIRKIKKAKFIKYVQPESVITYKKTKHKIVAIVDNNEVADFVL
jgi:3-hydroxymyristoyl/3-hydroxydecanoyl-(acyl carrier protein) dehydratase